MNNPFFVLLFLGIFTLIGGVTLGQLLRRVRRRQFSVDMVSSALGGLMFSLVPLLVAAFAYASMGVGYFWFAQLFLLVAVITIAGFLPDEILAALTAAPVIGTAAGGFFFLVGLYILWSAFQDRSGDSLLTGLLFLGVGLGTAALVVVPFLRNKNPDN